MSSLWVIWETDRYHWDPDTAPLTLQNDQNPDAMIFVPDNRNRQTAPQESAPVQKSSPSSAERTAPTKSNPI